MWPGSERFQAWLPNQEDVAYSPGLGFGLLSIMSPLMATMKQTESQGTKSCRGKVDQSYYALGCMAYSCSGNEKTLPRSCPYLSRKVCS